MKSDEMCLSMRSSLPSPPHLYAARPLENQCCFFHCACFYHPFACTFRQPMTTPWCLQMKNGTSGEYAPCHADLAPNQAALKAAYCARTAPGSKISPHSLTHSFIAEFFELTSTCLVSIWGKPVQEERIQALKTLLRDVIKQQIGDHLRYHIHQIIQQKVR